MEEGRDTDPLGVDSISTAIIANLTEDVLLLENTDPVSCKASCRGWPKSPLVGRGGYHLWEGT